MQLQLEAHHYDDFKLAVAYHIDSIFYCQYIFPM